ncbi:MULTISPECIES: TylF/MycF family methyltransferase [unclassified Streptomyces]|uniref:TylF/MycF family methyltransferase n=1 Tax=unclassified Streptomyces TaxID=2593676 RepID=UPI0016620281|nr:MULTISPECIES: TylF/MycF family methyltransferase [unclassified Streptomyces]MBD0844187.1 class I SAM-dependent methyltransferase [Streptomyces sp. TRM68416]
MDTAAQLYLDLMKKVLANTIYEDPPVPASWAPAHEYDELNRRLGVDWPSVAHTMIGVRRLENLEFCVRTVLEEGVPGDLIETGVWRGGACIFMRAVLKSYGVSDRLVWVADSFQGMPKAQESSHAGDRELASDRYNAFMATDLATVRRNFQRYDLLDDQVRFLPGWFRDTLPTAPVERLAVLRLDSDLYESTWDTLVHLYPKLSPGGFVIVDDYHIPVCAEAVHDWRQKFGVEDPIQDIDGLGVFWRRGS